MNIEDLNTMYETIYNQNQEIQEIFIQVEDSGDILFFLYNTEIKRHNKKLNSMIDDYETLILKLREAHEGIRTTLRNFGSEDSLAKAIFDDENLSIKLRELLLWKLRRIYMVYDSAPVMPYIKGDFLSYTWETAQSGGGYSGTTQSSTVETNSADEAVDTASAGEDSDEEQASDTGSKLKPEGDIFPSHKTEEPV